MDDIKQRALRLHETLRGKIQISVKKALLSRDDLSLQYTPGVAAACNAIVQNADSVYTYTMKGNCVAIVTDGSAILGLGNIGSAAGLPVMEGKSAIFKEFAGIDCFPICLAKQDVASTIQTVRNIAPTFGGIVLEDIKAPECFEIEAALQDLGIPVMHDDQHGTAVVCLAAMYNALKVVDKQLANIRIVVNGAGAAGIAITKLLILAGATGANIRMLDSKGVITSQRTDLAQHKANIAQITDSHDVPQTLHEVIRNADVFIGVSVKNVLTPDMVRSMSKNPMVIAMANPEPEIMPEDAIAAGAAVVATGRSDFPNQVNNALAFPGIYRGALDIRATRITEGMKLAAAKALASMIVSPRAEEILPAVTDKKVVRVVAEAVKQAWRESQ